MPIRVNYVTLCDERMAAYRYRMAIPGRYIGDYVISTQPVEADIYVYSKPYHDNKEILTHSLKTASGLNFVLDICDDVFRRRSIVPEYMLRMAKQAAVVTVPTKAMAEIVSRETSIDPVIISDPCEFPERPIKDISNPKVMWFGNGTNFDALKYYVGIDYPVEIVCVDNESIRINRKLLKFDHTFTEWSLENMRKAFDRNNIVIIPTLKKNNKNHNYRAKSPNRAFESIRNGLSVVASPLPSYKQFDEYITLDTDIQRGLKNVKQLTPEAQEYVHDNFDISVIGEQWKQLFKKTISSSTLDVVQDSLMVG
jgi:hypothetical protein